MPDRDLDEFTLGLLPIITLGIWAKTWYLLRSPYIEHRQGKVEYQKGPWLNTQ